MPKKIAVMTGTRAEYGILRPLLVRLNKDPKVELQLIVTGMHLSVEFGYTISEIEADGLPVAKRVEILLSGDSSVSLSKSVGLGFISFAEALEELKPELALVLGDRFEALAFAQSAVFAKIPVAHIHGGESTFGIIDEPIRHAITKFSSLHFTSTETYRKRIIQLGEHPRSVFNVGALGVENCQNTPLLSKEELEGFYDTSLNNHFFMITYHPETLTNSNTERDLSELLKALEKYPQAFKVFTYANADTNGRKINVMIDRWVEENTNAKAFESLGLVRYLSSLKYANLIIGNSSSGIIEAPSFGVRTINIGDRQKGRVQAKSVINCKPCTSELSAAIEISLNEEEKRNLKEIINPYEGTNTSLEIHKQLLKSDISCQKFFYDLA